MTQELPTNQGYRLPAPSQAAPCPLCGGVNYRPLFGPLLQCAACGLVRTDPSFVAPPAAVYDEAYYTERNAYLGDNTVFQRMFDRLVDGAQSYRPTGRLLDVGCGIGHLLQVAAAHGYTVEGCDISPWATSYARKQGLDVRTGTLESLHYPAHSFDVVTASHTLEHVPQPLPFLQEIRRILAGDGLLVIAVPNFGGLMAQALRTRWAGLLPDQHLWHFTPKTLSALLARGGFRTLRVTSDPYLHRHPNRVKDAALVALSGFGSLIGRSDYMTAYAIAGEDSKGT